MTRTPPAYFEELYRSNPDPWGFATSGYERRKYAITLASLLQDQYRSAFEPGCSIGVLTEQLADRSQHVLAMESMERPLEVARQRLQHLSHVEVVGGTVPDDWPDGPFDLLVLSELCYYFDAVELRHLIDRATATLEPGATIAAVHWSGETDYPLTADQAHAVLATTPTWRRAVHHVDEQFLLDIWRHQP